MATARLAAAMLPAAASATAQAPEPRDRVEPVVAYRISGAVAWAAARRAGFEFRPLVPGPGFILSGAPDGVRTSLRACDDPAGPCRTEAEIVDGGAIVLPPPCDDGCVRVHAFTLFAGRNLAAGWTLESVEVEGAGWSWDRPPTTGGASATLGLRVEARRGFPGSARVRALTLRGPAGASWRDAFRSP